MNLTYPSQEEAKRYRREIQDAVQAVRNEEIPEKTALAWPTGLDRRLLLGLPIQRRTRNCLLRGGVAAGVVLVRSLQIKSQRLVTAREDDMP